MARGKIKYMITGVRSDKASIVWRGAKPLIERALDHNDGEMETDDILGFIGDRRMQLWVVLDGSALVGVAVTEVVIYARRTIVRIVCLSGEGFSGWMDDMDRVLSKWGRAQGADGIEVIGRKGWTRKLARLDYKERHVILKKEIKP